MIVSDYGTSRLQLFSNKGSHAYTRSDLGLRAEEEKGLAWGTGGQLALAHGGVREVHVWLSGCPATSPAPLMVGSRYGWPVLL